LDTREFTGPNTQTVRVGFGPNPSSSCVIKVSAVSQSDVVFKPDRVSFGTVAPGQMFVGSMDVEYHGSLDWKIEEVVVAKELPFEATLTELVRQPGKVGYRLNVTLKTDARNGRIRTTLSENQSDRRSARARAGNRQRASAAGRKPVSTMTLAIGNTSRVPFVA